MVEGKHHLRKDPNFHPYPDDGGGGGSGGDDEINMAMVMTMVMIMVVMMKKKSNLIVILFVDPFKHYLLKMSTYYVRLLLGTDHCVLSDR